MFGVHVKKAQIALKGLLLEIWTLKVFLMSCHREKKTMLLETGGKVIC